MLIFIGTLQCNLCGCENEVIFASLDPKIVGFEKSYRFSP